jgi:hypothetical protein
VRLLAEIHDQVAGLLGGPFPGGMRSDSENPDVPAGVLDHGQDIGLGVENLCHQAVFVDDAARAVVAPDPEMIQVGDAIWQRPQWRGLAQGAVRTVELQESSYSRSTIIRWR